MNTAIAWEAAALAAAVGFAAGLLLMWLLLRPRINRNRQDRETLMQEFGQYRRKVDEHFVETAAAVDELNRSYEKVVRHLSSGAHALMGREALHAQLALRRDASVTVAYLADGSASGQAEPPEEAAANPLPPDAVAVQAPAVDFDEQTPVSDTPVITPPPLADDLPDVHDAPTPDASGNLRTPPPQAATDKPAP